MFKQFEDFWNRSYDCLHAIKIYFAMHKLAKTYKTKLFYTCLFSNTRCLNSKMARGKMTNGYDQAHDKKMTIDRSHLIVRFTCTTRSPLLTRRLLQNKKAAKGIDQIA